MATKLIIGCGYLGSRIASLWLTRGHRLFATTRTQAHADELDRQDIQPIIVDILDPKSLSVLPKAETVVYCVGYDRKSGQSMRDVHVRGLANVLEALPPPDRFIHVSSTGVYGQCDGEDVDESAATEPLEESGRIVLEAEHVLRNKVSGSIILRFAGIYGPGRLLRRQTIETGQPIVGDGSRWLNLIHVEDGAAAVLAAEERAKSGETYIICDDRPARRRDFYEMLARLLNAPQPSFLPPDPISPLPGHERANRRFVNSKMHGELAVALKFPSFEVGLPASV